jgi:hypothetical protein
MSRSLRKRGPSVASSVTPFGEQLEDGSRKVSAKRSNRIEPVADDIVSVAAAVFSELPRGFWWKLLPDLDEDLDVCIGSGRPWDQLLPLFLGAGLVRRSKGTTISKLETNRLVFEDLRHRFSVIGERLEFTHYRKRVGGEQRPLSMSYYICFGDPVYKNPQEQLEVRARCTTLDLRIQDVQTTRLLREYREKLETEDIECHLDTELAKTPDCSLAELDRIAQLQSVIGDTIRRQLTFDAAEDDQPNALPVPAPPAVQSLMELREQQIDYALVLDLERRPRLSRSGNIQIEIHQRKQARKEDRNRALQYALLWGYANVYLSPSERRKIAKAACRLVAYDHGYQQPLAHNMMPAWEGQLRDVLEKGEESESCTTPKHAGSKSYVSQIEAKYPGYIRELWRYAVKTKGSGATYQELAESMNEKSAAPGEARDELSLSRRQVCGWFKANGGVERSAKEKPILTEEMKKKRRAWAKKWGAILTDPYAPVAMLDEKWFYKRNRRRKLKDLPPAPGETIQGSKISRPKARSRRFPVKSMYMGLIGRPNKTYGFDGKILLIRVSEERELKQATTNERFVDDGALNSLLKEGVWRQLHTPWMTVAELRGAVVNEYQLEDDIADRLSFSYLTYYGKKGKTKPVLLEDEERIEDVEIRNSTEEEKVPLTISDVIMNVRYEKGDLIQEDVNCDSKFMLENIRTVGEAIRSAFYWVPKEELCYLFMDNAGGHGTIEAIEEYTKILKEEFNIEIVHQVPRSPETNCLDLGIWCCLQWAVDKLMRGRRGDVYALNKGVYEAWNTTNLEGAFSNVWKRLGRVLHLIEEDNGGNDLVEGKRGKKWAALDEPLPYENEAGPAAAPAAPAAATPATIDLLEEEDEDEEDEFEEK